MSSCQRRRGRSTRKKPGRFLRSNRRRRWIRLCSRITLSTRLGLTATPSRRRTNRRPSGTRRSDCRAPPRQPPARLDRGSGAAWAPFSASASETTPADSPPARAPHSPTDTPRRPDGATGRHARSLPARQRFSRDLQLVRLRAQRTLELSDLPPQLPLALALLLPRQLPEGGRPQAASPATSKRAPRRPGAPSRRPWRCDRRAGRPARSRSSAAPSSSDSSSARSTHRLLRSSDRC